MNLAAYAKQLDGLLYNKPMAGDQILHAMGMTKEEFRQVVLYHRMTLSGKAPWRTTPAALVQYYDSDVSYYEVSDDPVKLRAWARTRIKDGDTRLATIYAVSSVMVMLTRASSREGRKARLVVKHVGRLVDDLDDLYSEVSLP